MPTPKTYYHNLKEDHIYRVDNYGYARDTHEKFFVLKDIGNGMRWMVSTIELYNNRDEWERMPDDWYPSAENTTPAQHPVYTNMNQRSDNDDRVEDARRPWRNPDPHTYDDYYGHTGSRRR